MYVSQTRHGILIIKKWKHIENTAKNAQHVPKEVDLKLKSF
jgi:hypothetical protein